MGFIIEANKGEILTQSGFYEPIIYLKESFKNCDNAISVNVMLATELKKYNLKERSFRARSCLDKVLGDLPDEIVIKDFDVLFNPQYKIDVIATLINACRRKKFAAIWPGIYKNGKLIYAEEGFADYKVYEVKNYDITCVI